MTFDKFLKVAAGLAKQGIAHDQVRMRRARREFDRYATRMQALGLHPLTRAEIEDRQRELEGLLREIPNKYTDTPQMRALYSFTEENRT